MHKQSSAVWRHLNINFLLVSAKKSTPQEGQLKHS